MNNFKNFNKEKTRKSKELSSIIVLIIIFIALMFIPGFGIIIGALMGPIIIICIIAIIYLAIKKEKKE